jgi:hypothetical protein
MGRPQGSRNIYTIQFKQKIETALDSSIDSIKEDLEALTPKERLDVLSRLLPFILPRLKEVDVTTNQVEQPNEIKITIV